jgi:hypothetical protein
MPYTQAQVFSAFRYIHNSNLEGDIYLPSDQPEVMDDSDTSEGVWIHNCAVWISNEQIEQALADLSSL